MKHDEKAIKLKRNGELKREKRGRNKHGERWMMMMMMKKKG
jgi:hypothetical protein